MTAIALLEVFLVVLFALLLARSVPAPRQADWLAMVLIVILLVVLVRGIH